MWPSRPSKKSPGAGWHGGDAYWSGDSDKGFLNLFGTMWDAGDAINATLSSLFPPIVFLLYRILTIPPVWLFCAVLDFVQLCRVEEHNIFQGASGQPGMWDAGDAINATQSFLERLSNNAILH